ncbi:Plasma membrane proteolipid 3 [Ceratobasidium theobromae]|uniref:Plasma membrane proteolipid 3 n=1 Tax=Ceratobasidium theobromae TaxID=1582974 RepID=A0A5N5QVT2_9AGAM|nr:Plasma membrane proteolipid 3 [Ceratobasidium theobromae]
MQRWPGPCTRSAGDHIKHVPAPGPDPYLPPPIALIAMAFTASDIIKIILAIILPPLGVFFERGCGADLLINILLTILGYIPGIIHALYIIFKY